MNKRMASRHFHLRRAGDVKYSVLARATLAAYAAARGGGPASVFDVGCSIGELLRRLHELAGCLVAGVDAYADHDIAVHGGPHYVADIGLPKEAWLELGQHDLVVCQEVLEHVAPECTGTALDWLGQVAEPGAVLVFGAGHPGQRGAGHVNCRDRHEWAALLGVRGWRFSRRGCRAYARELRAGGLGAGCYIENTMVLVRACGQAAGVVDLG